MTQIHKIEQERAVYQNIRKFMTYILASNVPEFFPFLFMVLFKIPPALGFFSNRLIWFGIATEWMLILSIIYLVPLQTIFSTTALQPQQWLALLVCPPIVLLADECRKALLRKRNRRQPHPLPVAKHQTQNI